MAELEELEVGIGALAFELFIAGTIEHVLAVNDVGRVGDLEAWNGEDRIDRAQAEEPHQHGPPLVGAALEVFDLLEPFLTLDLIELGIEGFVLGHQILGHFLLAGLVVVAVEVDGVALDRQRDFFLVVDRQLPAVRDVLSGVGTDPDLVRLAKFDGIGDEGVDVLVVQRDEFRKAGLVHFALQYRLVVH